MQAVDGRLLPAGGQAGELQLVKTSSPFVRLFGHARKLTDCLSST